MAELTLVFPPLCSGGLFSLQHVSGSLSETDDGEAEKHVTGWVALDAQWVAGQLQWLIATTTTITTTTTTTPPPPHHLHHNTSTSHRYVNVIAVPRRRCTRKRRRYRR